MRLYLLKKAQFQIMQKNVTYVMRFKLNSS